jgi:hypothetical protein
MGIDALINSSAARARSDTTTSIACCRFKGPAIAQAVKINGDFRHYPSWLFTGHGIANSADFVGPILPVRHFT